MRLVVDAARSARAKPRRPALSDEIYDAIKTMILEHKISPREHVGISELARDLSVSQTPVREALARLEADGLVTKFPLRGYEATDLLTLEQFDDLFQFRELIEPWAAAAAARRGSRRAIELLNAEMNRAKDLALSGQASTYPDAVEHDTRFHSLVARASGSRYVEEAFLGTHCHMHLFRVYQATVNRELALGEVVGTAVLAQQMFDDYSSGDQPVGLNEHFEIAAAISSNDGETASELMLRHLRSSRQKFIRGVEALDVTEVMHSAARPRS